MPQGLQVWDASGVLIVDTSTLVYKEISIPTVTASGSVTVAVPAGATLVAIPTVDYAQASTNAAPEVSISGGTVSYNYVGTTGYQSKIRLVLL